ncbi:MAG: protein-L-isoaspartate(D-aspartate) O-methyltransferase [Actinobacteria bacterium]|nr:protein-L-isoaspartate(D-aspartate) O-methyltransferase [Actinomycetota bacterium]
MTSRSKLVESLRRRGIRDERVLGAIGRVPRELFVPGRLRGRAYDDGALPIGHGATISQPFMVAAICELLQLVGGERVLDVGTGSGYQAAVLAELAGEVVTIERVPELAEGARAALAAARYDDVDLRVGDGTLGVADRSPYDAIAVAAAAPTPPQALVGQLAPEGRLVIPTGGPRGQRLELVRRAGGSQSSVRSVACRFVPLVGSGGVGDATGWPRNS